MSLKKNEQYFRWIEDEASRSRHVVPILQPRSWWNIR